MASNRIQLPHHLGSGFALGWSQPGGPLDLPDLDVVVELELEVDNGRLVVRRFTAERRPGGPPVTVDVLKSMPLVSLAALAAEGGLLSGLLKVESTGGKSTRLRPASLADLEELPEAERAAVIYRVALFYGLPPTAAVAEHLGMSHDMAAKRVQAARLAGLLEPTTKGRKGG